VEFKETLAETTRLRLRTKEVQDASNDYRWKCDPEIAKYEGAVPLVQSYYVFLRRYANEINIINKNRRTLAIDTKEGQQIGNIMYYNARHSVGDAELGILIGEADFRGLGYGFEATVGFLRLVFESEMFNLIYLHSLDWNTRAQKCFENAGFSLVDRVSRRGHSFVRMETTREKWMMLDLEGYFSRPK
tara:strand:- start:9 stop:572 length:564 start_codon:yes stop_codon:yes gene_type:complete